MRELLSLLRRLSIDHRMSRQMTTVRQLYTKQHTGLGDQPSFMQIDRQFGTKWQCDNKEKAFYSVRKTNQPGAAVAKIPPPSSITWELARRTRIGTYCVSWYCDVVSKF
jgi:Transcriptional activator of glycolytic enzymes